MAQKALRERGRMRRFHQDFGLVQRLPLLLAVVFLSR